MKHLNIIFICLLILIYNISGCFQCLQFKKPFNVRWFANNVYAQCVDCAVCAKKIEANATTYFQKKQFQKAKETYLKAFELYQQGLKKYPRNPCLKTGYERTKAKLNLLERY